MRFPQRHRTAASTHSLRRPPCSSPAGKHRAFGPVALASAATVRPCALARGVGVASLAQRVRRALARWRNGSAGLRPCRRCQRKWRPALRRSAPAGPAPSAVAGASCSTKRRGCSPARCKSACRADDAGAGGSAGARPASRAQPGLTRAASCDWRPARPRQPAPL